MQQGGDSDEDNVRPGKSPANPEDEDDVGWH